MQIDELITKAIFSPNEKEKEQARLEIRELANEHGIHSSSIHELYMAFGRGEAAGFTVPALNIRALTYDTARLVFSLMKQHHIGAVVFEIARSEMGYTMQRPDEYAICTLAAALVEDYKGPVFIQGDHFQLNKKVFAENPEKELDAIKELAKEAIAAGFYNIDIDASTLVDLQQSTTEKQQETNSNITAELTTYIRSLQPDGIGISIGGEIGHIGGKNSTASEFAAFMEGYLKLINTQGISKVSVQTGSSHGGVPLPDGKIADVKLDFSVLETIGKIARNKYHIGGAVQHGASTLPQALFTKFPEVGTLEIHLATGFQNIVFDHMPQALRDEMYKHIEMNNKNEWDEDWTRDQFLYKTRKKALGPFKEKLWRLSSDEKRPILAALEKQLDFLFRSLNVYNTREVVEKYTV